MSCEGNSFHSFEPQISALPRCLVPREQMPGSLGLTVLLLDPVKVLQHLAPVDVLLVRGIPFAAWKKIPTNATEYHIMDDKTFIQSYML